MSEIVKRDEHGRWLKGTKGGPGRPASRDPHRYISILNDEMTDEEIRQSWRQQIDKAVDGDTKAFELILDRAVGRATLAVDLHEGQKEDKMLMLSMSLQRVADEVEQERLQTERLAKSQEPELIPSG